MISFKKFFVQIKSYLCLAEFFGFVDPGVEGGRGQTLAGQRPTEVVLCQMLNPDSCRQLFSKRLIRLQCRDCNVCPSKRLHLTIEKLLEILPRDVQMLDANENVSCKIINVQFTILATQFFMCIESIFGRSEFFVYQQIKSHLPKCLFDNQQMITFLLNK